MDWKELAFIALTAPPIHMPPATTMVYDHCIYGERVNVIEWCNCTILPWNGEWPIQYPANCIEVQHITESYTNIRNNDEPNSQKR